MTLFEKIQKEKIEYFEKRIKELSEEIKTQKATSIQDYIEKKYS